MVHGLPNASVLMSLMTLCIGLPDDTGEPFLLAVNDVPEPVMV